MVNTFLTDSDFSISAKSLDKRRLWKQILEAKQILRLIENIWFVSSVFGLPGPKSETPEDRKIFIRSVVSEYKKEDRHTLRYDDRENKIVKISFGFCYHPAVSMWLFYPSALVEYINAHIQEFHNRGGKPLDFLPLLSEETNFSRPDWTFSSDFHNRHKASLCRKDYAYYVPIFGNSVDLTLPYSWP